MPLQRLLQIVIAALAAMSTMLLGMGQHEAGMTLIVVLAAALSIWLTDVKGWVFLNRNLANLIMLGAALYSLRDLFNIYSEFQALNFAQLLIYLQIILLFQKKDSRTYWLLIMLSLLQVVVAALFSQGVFFGVLLVLYMLLASLGLTLLMLIRQSEPPRPPGKVKPALEQPAFEIKPVARWPLIGRPPALDGAAAGSSRQGVSRELFRRLAGMGARTLGMTMVLFVVVPRFGQVGWRGGIVQPQATVGFNDQVTLGEMGQIIESPNEVMRVRFFEGRTDDIPYRTSGEIYLYGAFLRDYEKGKWTTPSGQSAMGNRTYGPLPGERRPKKFVCQQCDLEGLDRNELFFIAPDVPLNVKSNGFITEDQYLGRLLRAEECRTRKFTYELGTTAFLDGVQSPLTPGTKEDSYQEKNEDGSFKIDNLSAARSYPWKNGEPALKKLKALADEWIAESKLPPEQVAERARYLERKLSSSGLYKYSLQGQQRDRSMDPIEDFLTEHRAGHCEYFATALTLLLRHVQIPARMIIGYKCDEWHEMEQCYQVRQLHAHAWVQVHLTYDQLPKEFLHAEEHWPWKKYGGWLRLDPTAASEEKTNPGFFAPVTKGIAWLDFAWSYYVVELNYERQRKAIFTPIAEAATKVFKTLSDPKTWRNFYERIGEALHRSGAAGAVAWLLLIISIAAGFALLGLIGYITWRISRKIWRMIASKRSKRRRGPRIEVEFYRRLEHLLAKHGLARPLGQTPREFAGVAGEWLAARTGENRLLPLPARVVEAYYHVRFGRLALEGSQSQEVEQILKDVEVQIAKQKIQTAK